MDTSCEVQREALYYQGGNGNSDYLQAGFESGTPQVLEGLGMRILATCVEESGNGCAWYRASTPFADMQRRDPSIQVITLPSNRIGWGQMLESDIFFMLRPFKSAHLELAMQAKNLGVPLWLDYDDDQLSIMPDNPTYPTFSRADVQGNISEMLGMADVVTVTTKHLKGEWSKLSKTIHVVPNAYADRWMRKWHRPDRQQSPIIAWRGTATHDRDLQSVAPEIYNWAEKNPKTAWAWIGHDPWSISEKIKNNIRIPAMDLLTYFKTISELAPKVLICPLADTKFNRSKSNIAAIEAIHAGAVCVAPNWEEWQIPGVTRYINEGPGVSGFDSAICWANGHGENKEYLEAGLRHIRGPLSLEVVNGQRIMLATKLYFGKAV